MSAFQEADILSIQIRPGVIVRVHGIPHDLSWAEADKLASIVVAYASGEKPAGVVQERQP